MFKSRAALAATLSGTYGIYNGFELLEHEPIPGREEYLDSEKYEIKVRDWDKPGNIKPYIRDLNRARRANRGAAADQQSALHSDRGRQRHRLRQGIRRPDQQRRRRDRAVARRRTNSGFRSATSRSASAGERRNVAAVENLITGERHPVEWGGIRLRIDPVRDPAAAVSLPGVRGRAMNVMSSIDAKRSCRSPTPDATSSGTRTPSSISFTSRPLPTATMTASAISPG